MEFALARCMCSFRDIVGGPVPGLSWTTFSAVACKAQVIIVADDGDDRRTLGRRRVSKFGFDEACSPEPVEDAVDDAAGDHATPSLSQAAMGHDGLADLQRHRTFRRPVDEAGTVRGAGDQVEVDRRIEVGAEPRITPDAPGSGHPAPLEQVAAIVVV